MGGSVSVISKRGKANCTSNLSNKAQCRAVNCEIGVDNNRGGCASPHTSVLLKLHKFAAGAIGNTCTGSALSEKCLLETIYSQPDSDIEGYLEIFRLPQEDAASYWKSSKVERVIDGTSEKPIRAQKVSTGIPTLGHATHKIYKGLFPHVTPLMQAVLHCNLKAVEMLIDLGADVNAVTPCDISYYRSDMPAIPKGASVLMLALYKLFDVNDNLLETERSVTGSSRNDAEPLNDATNLGSRPSTTCMESVLICYKLLNHPNIDVKLGFLNGLGDHVSAVTIADALMEASTNERFRSGGFISHSLTMVSRQVLTRTCRVGSNSVNRNHSTSNQDCDSKRRGSGSKKTYRAPTIKNDPTDDIGDRLTSVVVVGSA